MIHNYAYIIKVAFNCLFSALFRFKLLLLPRLLENLKSKKQEIPNVCAFIQKLKMERPNHTIYINNLNEKVKKEGKLVLTTI